MSKTTVTRRPDGLPVKIVVDSLNEPDTVTDSVTIPAVRELRTFNFTYYPSGEIDTIHIQVKNVGEDIIRDETIKHFRDGIQPIRTDNLNMV